MRSCPKKKFHVHFGRGGDAYACVPSGAPGLAGGAPSWTPGGPPPPFPLPRLPSNPCRAQEMALRFAALHARMAPAKTFIDLVGTRDKCNDVPGSIIIFFRPRRDFFAIFYFFRSGRTGIFPGPWSPPPHRAARQRTAHFGAVFGAFWRERAAARLFLPRCNGA